MNSIVARLRGLEETLDSVARDAFGAEEIPRLSDQDAAELLALTGRIQRRLEGVQIDATVLVRDRSEGLRDERMTTKFGCSRPADLVRTLTGSDTRGATRLVKAAGLVRRDLGFSDGAFLPARYQALREVIVSGVLGVAGLLAATDPLEQSARRISDEDRIEADRQLADFARGADPDGDPGCDEAAPRPLPLPEDLSVLAKVMVAYLDPDGAEPAEEATLRGRYFSIGKVRDGAIPVRGNLLPEVAGQLGLLMDSLLNPRVNGAEAPEEAPADKAERGGVHFEPSAEEEAGVEDNLAAADTRTPGQKRHDALAAILTTAAGSDLFPHLGGAAPTLVVAATAADLAAGHGWGSVAHTGDLVPISAALQAGCAGGIQRILFDENGRIVSIGTSSRIFNALQRRANRGVPEVRGPAWWDPHQHWHRARSPHRREPVPG
ncbi:DUF222 domain-containing protein [Microbacterium sp. A84]|uniref:DUF222 domain-containing protein n=1 Tax=Microbacterium sp. A84 TaxID=3450715 RepID=UPI003F41E26D